jgi:hypothetical protein
MTADPELDRLLKAKDAAGRRWAANRLRPQRQRDAQHSAECDYYDAEEAYNNYVESLK